MIGTRKSDLYDMVYKRALNSFNLTLETRQTTGDPMYFYVLETITKSYKEDIKKIDFEVKKFEDYELKKRKIERKIKKVIFVELCVEEYKKLPFLKKFLYRRKQKKLKKYNKKLSKLFYKYELYIYNAQVEPILAPLIESDALKQIKAITLGDRINAVDSKPGDVLKALEPDKKEEIKNEVVEDKPNIKIIFNDVGNGCEQSQFVLKDFFEEKEEDKKI